MITVARKNLFQNKTRLLLSVVGVALAIMLVVVLNGFVAGMYRQATAYEDHSAADFFVAQRGVENLLGATSLLPPETERAARQITGVAQVVPIFSQFVVLDLHDRKVTVYLIGYEPARGGGPWQLAAGREPASDDEIVLDRVMADRYDLSLGDTLEVLGQPSTVVGLSDETTSWMASFIFLRKSAVEALIRVPQATSFLLVRVDANASLVEVRRDLASLSGVEVLTPQELAENDLKLLVEVFSAPLQLMAGIAFLIGTLVVGLIIYTATVERQREYGVLKAVGARNRVLYVVVAAQALVATALGVIAGLGLASVTARLIGAAAPQFLVTLEPGGIGQAAVAGLSMALLAAFIPARYIARLDPARVFRR